MAEFVFINQRKQPDFILNNNYLSKDNYFKMHVHRLLEFNVQKEGYGTYIIGNRRYSSQPKDIFIVGNSEPHQLIPDKVSTIIT